MHKFYYLLAPYYAANIEGKEQTVNMVISTKNTVQDLNIIGEAHLLADISVVDEFIEHSGFLVDLLTKCGKDIVFLSTQEEKQKFANFMDFLVNLRTSVAPRKQPMPDQHGSEAQELARD